MERSCCICGMILAHDNSDFPQWCKDIRALCWFENQIILSGQGYMDDDVYPFRLPIPLHGFQLFHCVRDPEETASFCFPFHSACWNILLDSDYTGNVVQDIERLYRIFDSIHYWGHSLRWGHNYFLETLSTSVKVTKDEDLISKYRSDISILAEPSLDILSIDELKFVPQPFLLSTRLEQIPTPLDALPIELFYKILFHLDLKDVRMLFLAQRNSLQLNSSFWKSRFWLSGETGFAASILSLERSKEEQYFALRSELRQGSNMMKLRNRKRIWQLGFALNKLVDATRAFELRGRLATSSLEHRWESAVSCLAQKEDQEGCRELKQLCLPLIGRIRTLTMSYVIVFKEKLVCGLTFSLYDGRAFDLGYYPISESNEDHVKEQVENFPQSLWFVCSPSGFKHISLGYPKDFLESTVESEPVVITQRSLEGLTEICISLDFMRLVRFSLNASEQKDVDKILWQHPYPTAKPSFHTDDAKALIILQSKSFTPASFQVIPSDQLSAIKIYSALGRHAGITGFGILDVNHRESTWGVVNDSASLVFFLREAEHLAKVIVFRRGYTPHHLQFVTNLGRTSEHFPELPNQDGLVLERIEFAASNIRGFCGCFTVNPMQLQCFGVMSDVEASSSQSTWTTIRYEPIHKLGGLTLGGIRNHGQHGTCANLEKNYRSIQASVSTVESNYRRVGQVTGLLFYEAWSDTPQLLGQFTAFGKLHNLKDGEKILDIHVATVEPIARQLPRRGPSQVQSLAVVTNQRTIKWGKGDVKGEVHQRKKAIWEFNAIFDRLSCI